MKTVEGHECRVGSEFADAVVEDTMDECCSDADDIKSDITNDTEGDGIHLHEYQRMQEEQDQY